MQTKNKKALSNIILISLIISIIGMLVILISFNQYFNFIKEESSKKECSILFSQIKGKPTFYNQENFKPNIKLINLISKKCPYDDKKQTNKNNLKNIQNVITNCYEKTNFGSDILNSQSYGTSICLFCGRILIENQINNFDEKLSKQIKQNKKLFKNSTQIINLNSKYLDSKILKKNIEKNSYISVFYHIEKEELNSSIFLKTKSKLINYFSKKSQTFQLGNYYLNRITKKLESFGGIFLVYDINYNNQKKINIEKQNNQILKNCDILIIPQNSN